MHYKTITLHLLEANEPLNERLRQSRTMTATLDRLAAELRDRHLALKAELSATPNASGDPMRDAGWTVGRPIPWTDTLHTSARAVRGGSRSRCPRHGRPSWSVASAGGPVND
jgi:hypothetical protein